MSIIFHNFSHTLTSETTQPVIIRGATGADHEALVRIAQRDSKLVPVGALIVAETGGELRAALEIETGRAIADPFRHTADLLGLLRARAAQLRASRGRPLRVVAQSPAPVAQSRTIGHAAA
jgi:hypothetical protein